MPKTLITTGNASSQSMYIIMKYDCPMYNVSNFTVDVKVFRICRSKVTVKVIKSNHLGEEKYLLQEMRF